MQPITSTVETQVLKATCTWRKSCPMSHTQSTPIQFSSEQLQPSLSMGTQRMWASAAAHLHFQGSHHRQSQSQLEPHVSTQVPVCNGVSGCNKVAHSWLVYRPCNKEDCTTTRVRNHVRKSVNKSAALHMGLEATAMSIWTLHSQLLKLFHRGHDYCQSAHRHRQVT